MLYMVIEHYSHGPEPVYRRAAEQGRMLPDGLHYLDSWIVADEPSRASFTCHAGTHRAPGTR